jgi:glutamate 5-kinase
MIRSTKRWVVKIGSAMLTANGQGLAQDRLGQWVRQMADWVKSGHELILVSSGAVAEGMSRMGMTSRPETLHELQAAAAVGQMGLVQAWESRFKEHAIHTAQVLLIHDDLADRERYLNARTTLRTLIEWGVVPVINENDTVATEELKFGDNDTLAALVANLIEADLLILLTDQEGLFDSDPRSNPDAKLIRESRVDNPELDQVAGGTGGGLGKGGMATKLRASRTAARSGTQTIIASGGGPNVLDRIRDGEEVGTLLIPAEGPVASRKRWLAGQLQSAGKLVLDAGAVRALREQGKSLLAVGVKGVEGEFERGDLVTCVDAKGREIARGLVNFDADEAIRIMGQPTSRFEEILGYQETDVLIHRDNLALV